MTETSPRGTGRGKRLTMIVTACGAVAVMLAACAPQGSADSVPTTLTIAVPYASDPDYAQPSYISVQSNAVYDFIMHMDPETDEPQPWIATEWSYNDDRTVLSVTIRDDVDFVDGTRLDAEAIKANLIHQRDVVQSAYFAKVSDVEVTGDYTLDVHLSQPDGQLLHYVGVTAVVAPSGLADTESLVSTPIGSGPYLIDPDGTTSESQWTFVRDEDYWNDEAFPFDTVVVKAMTDVTARVNALKSGQVDYADVDGNSAPDLEAEGFNIITMSTPIGLVFSDRAGTIYPPLGDVRVRQAFNYAIDREAIAEFTDFGMGNPDDQPYPEGYAYHDPDSEAYEFDPDKARELLTEAGYPEGLDITMPSIVPDYEPVLTQQLGDVGIRVTFEVVDSGVWFPKLLNGEYPVFLWKDIYLNWINNLVVPTGFANGLHYTTPELDDLLSRINGVSEEDAVAASIELGRLMHDEAWFAMVAHAPTFQATVPGIIARPEQAVGGFALAPLWDILPTG